MAMCRIPGERMLQWSLVLPLAMPGYIIGYIYTDWFDYAGPVQIFLRDVFGWQSVHDYWFPSIRSLGGACIVLALVLYPYVYLLARAAFMEQSASCCNRPVCCVVRRGTASAVFRCRWRARQLRLACRW